MQDKPRLASYSEVTGGTSILRQLADRKDPLSHREVIESVRSLEKLAILTRGEAITIYAIFGWAAEQRTDSMPPRTFFSTKGGFIKAIRPSMAIFDAPTKAWVRFHALRLFQECRIDDDAKQKAQALQEKIRSNVEKARKRHLN